MKIRYSQETGTARKGAKTKKLTIITKNQQHPPTVVPRRERGGEVLREFTTYRARGGWGGAAGVFHRFFG